MNNPYHGDDPPCSVTVPSMSEHAGIREGQHVYVPADALDDPMSPGTIIPGYYPVRHIKPASSVCPVEFGIDVKIRGGGGEDMCWEYAEAHPDEVETALIYFEDDDIRAWQQSAPPNPNA